jgi:hypothetical protein
MRRIGQDGLSLEEELSFTAFPIIKAERIHWECNFLVKCGYSEERQQWSLFDDCLMHWSIVSQEVLDTGTKQSAKETRNGWKMRSEVEHQNDARSQKQVAIEAKLSLN